MSWCESKLRFVLISITGLKTKRSIVAEHRVEVTADQWVAVRLPTRPAATVDKTVAAVSTFGDPACLLEGVKWLL